MNVCVQICTHTYMIRVHVPSNESLITCTSSCTSTSTVENKSEKARKSFSPARFCVPCNHSLFCVKFGNIPWVVRGTSVYFCTSTVAKIFPLPKPGGSSNRPPLFQRDSVVEQRVTRHTMDCIDQDLQYGCHTADTTWPVSSNHLTTTMLTTLASLKHCHV